MQEGSESGDQLLARLRDVIRNARSAQDARAQEKILSDLLAQARRDLAAADSEDGFRRIARDYRDLSEDDEVMIIRLAQQGNGKSRELACALLALYHIPLILWFARFVHPYEVADVVQSGIIGLLDCIDDFSLAAGVRFNTFARHHIHRETAIHIAQRSRVMRLPEGDLGLVTDFENARRILKNELQSEPSHQEVVDHLHWDEKHSQRVWHARNAHRIQSLDFMFERGQQVPESEVQPPDDQELTFDLEALLRGQERQLPEAGELLPMLDLLPPRWREVLVLRYGVEGDKPQTLAQVAVKLKVSIAMVQKLERKALRRVREDYFTRRDLD